MNIYIFIPKGGYFKLYFIDKSIAISAQLQYTQYNMGLLQSVIFALNRKYNFQALFINKKQYMFNLTSR